TLGGCRHAQKIDDLDRNALALQVREQAFPAPATVPCTMHEDQFHEAACSGFGGWMKRQGSASDPLGTLTSMSQGRPSARARSSTGRSAAGESTRVEETPKDSARRTKSGFTRSEPSRRPSNSRSWA